MFFVAGRSDASPHTVSFPNSVIGLYKMRKFNTNWPTENRWRQTMAYTANFKQIRRKRATVSRHRNIVRIIRCIYTSTSTAYDSWHYSLTRLSLSGPASLKTSTSDYNPRLVAMSCSTLMSTRCSRRSSVIEQRTALFTRATLLLVRSHSLDVIEMVAHILTSWTRLG